MSAKSAWKWRVFWLVITSGSLYAVFLIASRRYRAELVAISGKLEHQNMLVNEMLISVKNGLRTHG
jgi:hypothetical protein